MIAITCDLLARCYPGTTDHPVPFNARNFQSLDAVLPEIIPPTLLLGKIDDT